MRIPSWTPEAAVREPELVDAILARRGGKLLKFDRALLWSAPLARAWNVFLGAIRREMAFDARLREIAICVGLARPGPNTSSRIIGPNT